jgi:protein transport protein SEC20
LSALVRRMNDEVKVSEQATRILTCSSEILRETNSHFNSIGNTIVGSGRLISKFGRRETTDSILIVLALLLYFGVILYILKKRVFRSFVDLLWWRE